MIYNVTLKRLVSDSGGLNWVTCELQMVLSRDVPDLVAYSESAGWSQVIVEKHHAFCTCEVCI